MPQPLAIQLTVDADGLVSGLKVAGKEVDGAAQKFRASFKGAGDAANDATEPIDGFVEHVRGMRKEAFLGNFMAGQIAAVGIASKGAASEVTGLVAAFALGGGLGLAIEAVKVIAIGFKESGVEIEKANETAEKSIKALKEQTDSLIMSIKGLSEAEKLRQKEIVPLDEQRKAQTVSWTRALAELYAAQEKMNDAQKQGVSGSSLALLQGAVDRAQSRVEKAQALLDITKKQIEEESKAIGGVAAAQSQKDLKAAHEQTALDAAKWIAFQTEEWKKHYTEVTAETLKFLQDADAAKAAEDKFAFHLYEESIKDQEALDKDIFQRTLDRLNQEKLARKQMVEEWQRSAKNIGDAFGKAFAGIATGSATALGAAKDAISEMVKAVVAGAVKMLEAYAISSEGAAFFSQAGIPMIGPILAIAAAASAGAFVEGLIASMPSAAVGMPFVPQDMPVYVHKGEQILTVAEANQRRAGGGGGGDTFQITVHAIDGPSVQRFFESPAAVRAIREARRNGHPV